MGRELTVQLPVLHPDQVAANRLIDPATGRRARFRAVRCGRRWGKTALDVTEACDAAAKGQYVGWFAPEYKLLAEAYRDIEGILDPIKKSASRDGVFTTITDGRIDFWSLENENAGRSRKYHLAIIDEGAFTKNGVMMGIWEKAIYPTLLDYSGRALVTSNTNGVDPENFMWQICNEPKYGFVDYHAPTMNNPHIPMKMTGETDEEYVERRIAVFDDLRATRHPLVYQQEILAEFVDWSGVAFFALDKLLVGGQPVPTPSRVDAVYAIIDCATKTGRENDGTAVVYAAVTKHGAGSHPLVILDWDIMQIEGALLETWLPSVLQNLELLAMRCKARFGSGGALIEDKDAGQILLQQARRRKLKAEGIDSKLTSVGKDERAISVSGYVHRGMVKLSQDAYDKTVQYKGVSRNHLLSQVVGFRIGDKEASKRADDLLDGFVYAIAVGLGNKEGF